MAVGYYELRQSPDGTRRAVNLPLSIDWSPHPVWSTSNKVASCAWEVQTPNAQNGAVPGDITLSGGGVGTVSPDGKQAQIQVTDVAAKPGNTYVLVCQVTMQNGVQLDPDSIDLPTKVLT